MFCEKCGAQLSHTAQFCNKCGEAIKTSEERTSIVEKKKKDWKQPLVIGLILAGILFVMIMFFLPKEDAAQAGQIKENIISETKESDTVTQREMSEENIVSTESAVDDKEIETASESEMDGESKAINEIEDDVTGNNEDAKEVEEGKKINKIVDLATIDNLTVGDSVFFGTYEQDNNLENGTEDIEWEVVDIKDNSALIYSKKILDIANFHNSMVDSDTFCWGQSDLRNWMNLEFYGKAFNDTEKNCIRPMHIVDGSTVTDDKVFLLSKIEMEEYRLSTGARPSRYAYNAGITISVDQWGEYWLRSWEKGEWYINKQINTVDNDGKIVTKNMNESKNGYNERFGVRPAVWISFDSEELAEPISCPFEAQENYVKPSEFVLERTSLEVGEKVIFGKASGEEMYWYVAEALDGEYLLINEGFDYGWEGRYEGKEPWKDEDAVAWLDNERFFDIFTSQEQNLIIAKNGVDGNMHDLQYLTKEERGLYDEIPGMNRGAIKVWIAY